MLFPGLKKWAALQGWARAGNTVWGEYGGYLFSAFDGSGFKLFSVALTGLDEEARAELYQEFLRRKQEHGAKNVFMVGKEGNCISLQFRESLLPMKTAQMETLLTVAAEILRAHNVKGNGICLECNADSGRPVLVDEVVVAMCESCYSSFEEQVAATAAANDNEEKNYGAGVVGAITGGLLGSIPWILVAGIFDIMAVMLAYLIGFVSLKGYTWLGGRIGKWTKWIVLASTVFSLLLAQVVMLAIAMVRYDIPLTLLNFALIITDIEVLKAMATDSAFALALAALGIWPLFRSITSEEKVAPQLQRLDA